MKTNLLLWFIIIVFFSCEEKKNQVVPFSYDKLPYYRWRNDSILIFEMVNDKVSVDIDNCEIFIMDYDHWRYEFYIKISHFGHDEISGFTINPVINGQKKEELFNDFGIQQLDTFKCLKPLEIHYGRFVSNEKVKMRFELLSKLKSMPTLWNDIQLAGNLDKLGNMNIRSIVNSKYEYCRFEGIYKADSAFYNNMKMQFVGTKKLDCLREMK